MLSQFGKVYAYEPHKPTQKYLKLNFKNKKFNIISSIGKKKFDLIFLADVLEHLKNDKRENYLDY